MDESLKTAFCEALKEHQGYYMSLQETIATAFVDACEAHGIVDPRVLEAAKVAARSFLHLLMQTKGDMTLATIRFAVPLQACIGRHPFSVAEAVQLNLKIRVAENAGYKLDSQEKALLETLCVEIVGAVETVLNKD